MEYTKEDHDMIVTIHTEMVGLNGSGGLVKRARDNSKAITKIKVAIGILVASVGGLRFWM